jgi:hypothetical protein
MTTKLDFWRLRRAFAAVVISTAACESVTATQRDLDSGPARFDVLSGNQQSAAPGSELPEPLVVRVLDGNGQPVSSQIINFVVTQGGGSPYAGISVTNAQGIAQDRWTVGPTAGVQTLEARAVDATSGAKLVFATFTATVSDPASIVETVSISPSSVGLKVNAKQQLTATARNASGVILTGKTYIWTSSNASVATVDGSGLVTALASGTATITATTEGKSGTSVITVRRGRK